nr:C10 family peptidase [Bacteroidota bacterium]
MKTKITFLLLTILFSMPVFAGFVPLETAQKVALNFYIEKYNQYEGAVSFDDLHMQYTFIKQREGEVFYYVFHFNKGGFVIVPADDCLAPVLGYSLKHEFVAENQPPNVQYWFRQYEDQVSYARKNKIEPEKSITDHWAYFLDNSFISTKPALNSKEVEPLITTLWDQDFPFNYYCPSNSLTGCHATAMAQIAYYWRWPDHGQGYTSYTPESNPQYGVQTADYENTWYRYNEMVDDPETANTAIAEYIYHFSVSYLTDFGTDISYPGNLFMQNHQLALDSLSYHFKLIPSTFFYSDSMSGVEWKNNILNMLDAASPVFYAGYSQYPDIGHFFICDGYQDEEYFHFNFGWGGISDGYYTLDNILGYNSHQFCSSIIQPDTVQFNYPFYASGADTLNTVEGSITDGSGPVNDYLNNTQALWLIEPQTEYDSVTNITIMVKRLDLFNDGDRLYIYDGEDNTAPLLAELNGYAIPEDIESTGNKVFVEFVTDGQNTAPGFYLNYHCEQPVWCSGMTQLTAPIATFDDGSVNFNYYNGTICMWTIVPGITEPLTLNFNYFDTEEGYDILKIFDYENQELLAEISGTWEDSPEPVTSPSGKMFITFTTNNNTRANGWEVWYDINTGIAENMCPVEFSISPNPVASDVNIRFALKSETKVNIQILDIVGRELARIFEGKLTQGHQSITGNLSHLSQGIYFCRLHVGDEVVVKKIIKH